MDSEILQFLAAAAINRMVIIGSGLILAVIGFLMFLKGINKGGANFEWEFQGNKVTVGKGGPGIIFVAIAGVIMAVGAYRDFEMQFGEHHIRADVPQFVPVDPRYAAQGGWSPQVYAAAFKELEGLDAGVYIIGMVKTGSPDGGHQ